MKVIHPHAENTKMLCLYTDQRFCCKYKATKKGMKSKVWGNSLSVVSVDRREGGGHLKVTI